MGGDREMAAIAPEPPLTGWQPSLAERLSYEFKDHALLRRPWANFEEIAPGILRGNQPGAARLARLQREGLKAVISLRGAPDNTAHKMEAAACARLGLPLYATGLQARKAPQKAAVLRLFDLFEAVPRPFLMHCKSGADRAGLASALYILQHGGRIETALGQLSLRFLHLKGAKTGVLDLVLKHYAAAHAETGIGIEAWFAGPYDRDAIQAAFDAGERGGARAGARA